MKRLMSFSILILFSIVISIGSASAVNTCSNSDDIILRLSGADNAHAEIYNGAGDYNEGICASDLFLSGLTTSRTCTGTNSIVQLSSNTNAHLELISQTSYDSGEEICYSDLNCVVANGICPTGKVSVLSLSDVTNAHGARGIGYNQVICCSSPTVNPICNFNTQCESGRGEDQYNCQDCQVDSCGNGVLNPGEQCDSVKVPPFASTLSCTDFDELTGGTLSCNGNTCFLDLSSCTPSTSGTCGDNIVNGLEQCDGSVPSNINCQSFGFAGGTLGCFAQGNANQCMLDTSGCTTTFGGEITNARWISFAGNEITESCLGANVKLLIENTFSQNTEVNIEIFRERVIGDDSIAIESFTAMISSTNNKITWNLDSSKVSQNQNIYFEVSYGDSGIVSNNLNIKSAGECANTNPIARILSPEQGELYLVNSEVIFEGSCTDAESDVIYNWDIEGVTLPEGVGDSANFAYIFSIAGQKNIRLQCIDDRGEDDIARVSILVVGEEPGINAFIDEPEYHSVVQDDHRVVDFSAGESYVVDSAVDIETCMGEIICLAGDCPFLVSGLDSLNSCNGEDDILITGDSNRGNFNDIEFTWSFNDGSSFASQPGFYSGSKRFASASQTENDKWINALLRYNEAGISLQGEDRTEFTLIAGDICLRTDASAEIIDLDESGNEIARYVIGGSGGVSCNYLGAEVCCPNGFSCNTNTGNCELSVNTQCSDYITENECDDDDLHLAEIDPARQGIGCGTIDSATGKTIICACDWNTNNQCVLKSYFEPCQNCGGEPPRVCTAPVAPSCSWSPASGQSYKCNEGDTLKRVQINGIFNAGDPSQCGNYADFINEKRTECLAGKIIDIDCNARGVKLPFFGGIQFIISIFSIAAVYYLFSLKEKKRNAKEK